MSGTTYYQRSKDVILNRAKNYYENNKERFREQAKINIKTYILRPFFIMKIWDYTVYIYFYFCFYVLIIIPINRFAFKIYLH